MFTWGFPAIEAGEFCCQADFMFVAAESRRHSLSFGLHAPLSRGGNRYGLLSGEESAWAELRCDLQAAKSEGLTYVVVHFPHVLPGVDLQTTKSRLRVSVERFRELSDSCGIPIVAEPKLGPGRDPTGMALLMEHTQRELLSWRLPLCLDVGDLYLAAAALNADYLSLVSHLGPVTQVVHLHDVLLQDDQYFWTPVGPASSVPIVETLRYLPYGERDIVAVLEHTPQPNNSEQQAGDAAIWLQEQLAHLGCPAPNGPTSVTQTRRS